VGAGRHTVNDEETAMNIEIHQMTGGSHVFGPHGTVINSGAPVDQLHQAVADFLRTLQDHRGELQDPDRVRAAATALRDETRAPRPRRERLLALLRDTAAGAGDVAAVAGAAQVVAEAVHVLS
jgi:hypothetical protein